MKEQVEKFVKDSGIKGGYIVVDGRPLRNLSKANAMQTFDKSKECTVWKVENGKAKVVMSK